MTTASPPRPSAAPPPRPSARTARPKAEPQPPQAKPPRVRKRRPQLAVYTELLLTVLAVAAGAAVFRRYYGGLGWIAPVLGALLLGAALAALFAWRRWPGWVLAPVAVGALLVFQLYALYFGATNSGLPTLDALTAVGDGLLSGWARMLTVALPADPSGDLLATPTLLTFAAGIVSGVLVLRTRAVVALAAAPVVVFVAGLLFTAARPGSAMIETGVLLTLLAVLLLVRTNRQSSTEDGLAEASAGAVGLDLSAQRRHSVTGRVLIGLPAVALVIAAAVVAGVYLPIADGSDRADPRSLITPDVEQSTGLSPLVQVRPQLSLQPPIALYSVTVPAGGPAIHNIRLAALDTFDGALWGQSGQFVPAGSVLPTLLPRPATAQDVTLQVQVLSERSPFLPVVGEPEQLDGLSAAMNTGSGNLIADTDGAGTAPSVPSGTTYQVESYVVPLDGFESAAVAPDPARWVALPDRPDWVDTTARNITAEFTTPTGKLLALQKYLQAGKYSILARPGESYAALQRVLFGAKDERYGYAEQYASAFGVLARSLGFPTRIAVGYRLDDTRRTGDTYTVTTADAHAWPEVLLDGYGWVAFEPTTVTTDSVPPPPINPEIDQDPQQPTDPEQGQQDPGGQDAAVPADSAGGLPQPVLIGLFVIAGIVALVVLVVAGIVLAKRIRRSKRRSTGSPARRIAAAWQEVRDRLREAGHPTRSSQTPAEVAEQIGALPPGRSGLGPAKDALTELSVLVTAAVCAPTGPTPVAAKRAWALHDTVVKALAERRPLWARILAAVDPRPLFPKAGRLADDPTPPASGDARRPAKTPERAAR